MQARELIRAGRLSEARDELTEAVKTSPGDSGSRTLLFQVLAFCGEWGKARRHLEMIATQDSTRMLGAQVYLNLIQAETERLEVFQDNRRPSFLPKAPAYFDRYETAWQLVLEKKTADAAAAFDRINSDRPVISGTLNSTKFSGFKESDSRLSNFLEAFVHERYVWVPFESLRELAISPPENLFDLLWASAQITTWEGLTLNGFLPVTYPGSFCHEDDRIKLGRLTDWAPLGGEFVKASGQHVYLPGKLEIGLLEIREAVFNSP